MWRVFRPIPAQISVGQYKQSGSLGVGPEVEEAVPCPGLAPSTDRESAAPAAFPSGRSAGGGTGLQWRWTAIFRRRPGGGFAARSKIAVRAAILRFASALAAPATCVAGIWLRVQSRSVSGGRSP